MESTGINKSQMGCANIYKYQQNSSECIISLFMHLEATFPDNIIFQISQCKSPNYKACGQNNY